MTKEFNTTGKCNATRHYMADVSHKLAQTMEMVEDGRYFIISRPCQSGKTTFLYKLADKIRNTGDYFVFNISFENVDKNKDSALKSGSGDGSPDHGAADSTAADEVPDVTATSGDPLPVTPAPAPTPSVQPPVVVAPPVKGGAPIPLRHAR